jgi:hypothetical protein
MPGHRLPKSRHHWLRLSVRGLIVLVLIIGATLGWVVRSARVQRQALAAIRRAGGNYGYDWQHIGDEFFPNARGNWREWLVDRVGEDYFAHVKWVSLSFMWVPDGEPPTVFDKRIILEALAQIGNLSRLEQLDIEGTEAGDSGLVNLEHLTHLKTLSVCDFDLTDPGFLETMTELEHLDLNDSSVGDAGLAHLKRLTRLRILELVRTKITDGGLAHLKGLTSLQSVYLEDTKITDAGVRDLQRALPKLKISR